MVAGKYLLSGGLEHRVLPGHVVGRDGEVGVVLEELDDVQVRHPGLHLHASCHFQLSQVIASPSVTTTP